MSLVEQAIQRMQRTPGETPGDEPRKSPPVAPSHLGPANPTGGAKLLTIEVNSLRAGGYLPEADKDREFADHYRLIKRPIIQKALAGTSSATSPDRRLIMVTSALPGDGKTFTSINLAFSLARERDVSVLLVDADILKPHVSKIFGLQQEPGLTDALQDENLPAESLIIGTNVRGLSILPAGAPTEGSSELLSSDRMRRIAKSLCTADPRRLVLLDSPPLLITTEGPALISVSGQVILVVRAGLTPRRAVSDAVGLIDKERAGGIVLNEARMGLMHGYYGYGTYGSYGDADPPKV